MAIKFFGHFLLDTGKLTKSQLIEAVEYQNENNLSLGELATREKLISDADAIIINDRQRVEDKRFGEIATSMGLLSDEQISSLLDIQKQEKIFFGEILVLKNFMDKDTVDRELKHFEDEQSIDMIELDSRIAEIDTNGNIALCIGILQKLYYRIVLSPIKLVKVDRDVERTGIIAMQKMRGDVNLDFAIQSQDQVALDISSKFMKMQFVEIEEMVYDIMSEFVNVVLGNIAVKLSSNGNKVDLTPPVIVEQEDFNYSDYHCFDFLTTQGKLTLCIKI